MQHKPLVIALSAVGISLVVHGSRIRSHRARGASDSQITDGKVVTVYGPADANAVCTTHVQSHDQNTNGTNAERTVEPVETDTPPLTTTPGEDSEHSDATVSVNDPAPVDLSPSTQGESVEPLTSPNPDPEQSSNDTGPRNDHDATNGDNPGSAQQVSTAEQFDPNLATSHLPQGQELRRSWAMDNPQTHPLSWRPAYRPSDGADRP